MSSDTTLFRARVPTARLRRVEKILAKMGTTPGGALNMLLAQVELQEGLPFAVAARPGPLLTAEDQASAWTASLDAY